MRNNVLGESIIWVQILKLSSSYKKIIMKNEPNEPTPWHEIKDNETTT